MQKITQETDSAGQTQQLALAAIFNEWAARYARDPEAFADAILDADGKPVVDYGKRCAIYFIEIANDLYAKAALPPFSGEVAA